MKILTLKYLVAVAASCACVAVLTLADDAGKTGNIIVLKTTQGVIELRLMPDIAPKACENFVRHVKEGYYDGVLFHRVIKGFMIQSGDPTGTGRGGASIWGKPFEDEFNQHVKFDRKGLLAMANAGPGTNGSQFFITTAATPWLNMRHTIFGEVISGYNVVAKIDNQPTDAMARPLREQKIIKAAVRQPKMIGRH